MRPGEPDSPSRVDALLQAFAIERAIRERDTHTLSLGLMKALGRRR